MKTRTLRTIILSILLLQNIPVSFAQENEDLKKQVEMLQERVEELETERGAPAGIPSPFLAPRKGVWDPSEELSRMQQEMDGMFRDSFGRSGNRQGMFSSDMSFEYDLDLKEVEDGYEIRFGMAGLDQEKVSIQINENSITVTGERSSQNTEEEPGRYYSSQSFGSFMKTIPLPVDADVTKMQTEKKEDELIIKLPKK